MTHANRLLVVLVGIALLCSILGAQESVVSQTPAVVPRLVNFSANATDAQGKTITSIAGATFAIYKDQYEGAPLWLETQNIQPDAKGNYTVQLGATKPEGVPLDLFTSGEARWLGVTINGEQEQARVVLLSVPYALKAADAETVGGLPASAFLLVNKLQTNGTSAKISPAASGKTVAPPANPAVTGKGVVDFIPMWDTTSDIVDSVLFQKSSQIGIGTTTPAATLDVNGKGDVRDTLTLFPKGTDPTLAINGTSFKIDQTGKVTFTSAQTFPGTGTVTTVGLSAPSSDFKVTGSPVTKSGTLTFNWNVAPTNLNTANAIVKRDGTGSFFAESVSAAQLTASNPGGVALVASTSASNAAITGTSTGTNAVSDGVDGVSYAASASGVAGINYAKGTGVGVYGTGGTGVVGLQNSYNPYSGGGYFTGYTAASGSGTGGGDGALAYGGAGDPTSSGAGGGFGIFAVGASGPFADGAGGFLEGANSSFYGDGVDAYPGSGYAGYFAGDVYINGTVYTGAKDFKIDHPLDPANKYLFHASVESSEMMDIYTGNVTTDAQGEATVHLPAWFEAVNADFRYQLTVIGQFAQATVARKIQNHEFTIRTSAPDAEVSWQVTGVRHDAYANAHPLVVEGQKEGRLRGFYLHPELYGALPEKQEEWARHPNVMQRLKNPRALHPAAARAGIPSRP